MGSGVLHPKSDRKAETADAGAVEVERWSA